MILWFGSVFIPAIGHCIHGYKLECLPRLPLNTNFHFSHRVASRVKLMLLATIIEVITKKGYNHMTLQAKQIITHHISAAEFLLVDGIGVGVVFGPGSY